MFQLSLFKIRAFTAGSIAGFLAAVARGGLQFMLVIWLQGIWLPLHGYSYTDTPLWAGIYLLPLTRRLPLRRARSRATSPTATARAGFATGGMVVFGASFIGLMLLPVNFPYWAFALLIFANGIGVGMFSCAQLLVDHGQRPGLPARRRLGDALDLPEHRHGALDRDLLLADDRRAVEHALPATLSSGLHAARASRRASPTTSPTCRRSRRSSPPSSASTRSSTCSRPTARSARSPTRAAHTSPASTSSPN